MQKEQIAKLRELHGEYDMCVFRTEGKYHHEKGELSYILWDDNAGICHSVNTNTDHYLSPSLPIKIDSFDYEAITGIYSDVDKAGLKAFLNKLKNDNILNEQDYNTIMEDYKDFK